MASGSEMFEKSPERIIGRYAIYDEIASGGMAVVHLGRMLGQAGFSRTVAVKRLHPQFAKNPNFVAMFLDEARLAVRVQHPNVVAPLDVLVADGEVLVVMEYVAGETLARLQRSTVAKAHTPTPSIVVSIMTNALYGLHAAHEAVGEDGAALNIVHRDVSPQNIMIGTNGIARVLDFGVAMAAVRSQFTANGEVKGKLAYMAPEQVESTTLDRRTDIFAAGIVIWESLARRRLFLTDQPSSTISRILHGKIPLPSKYSNAVSPDLDQAILRALERNPDRRYQTAREFAVALERACAPATPSDVGDWVKLVGGDSLSVRAERVAAIETKSSSSVIRPLQPPPRISETHRVPVPAPPIDPDAKLQRSQSRITISLVDPARIPAPAVVAPAPSQPEEGSAAATLEGPESKRRRSAGWTIAAGALVIAASAVGLARRSPMDHSAKPLPSLGVEAGSIAQAAAEAEHRLQSFIVDGRRSNAASGAASSETSLDAVAATARGALPDSSDVRPKHRERKTRAMATKPAPAVGAEHAARAGGTKRADPPKASANCNPPFTVDAKGIRRLRPECL